MRNINELIGIINGISYDGIVNQLEVQRLSIWIKNNRNLSYDAKQARLISFVDQILEDGIITNDKRVKLLDYCDQYTIDGITDSSSKIYELNGIIEGIVCDNEINKQEMYRLREWMTLHSSYICSHKPSELICEKIDQILESGIVTKDEQENLLDMLKNRILDAQLETRIVYLKSCVIEKKNIGVDLIGLLDSADAINIIHSRAEKELFMALNTYSGASVRDPEIIFISLVIIGMFFYDGAFYEYVRKTYSHLYQKYSEQKIEDLIRTILNRYRANEETSTARTRIINVALAGSIVPSYFLGSFFEFIYDIYKLNFDQNLPQDLYGEFHFVFEGLQSVICSEGDDLQLNATKKTYKLIKSTKQLIANPNYIDAVINLSIIVVRLIDKYIWGKDVELYNPYLKKGYEEWLHTLEKEKGRTYSKKADQLRSRWEPEFILRDNSIYLVPPIHRVKSSYSYREIRVVVKKGDNIVYENLVPDIYEIIGGYQIKNKWIKISAPLNDVKYLLFAGDKEIYNSKDKLFREFIVFDSNGNELLNNRDYTGTAIFCTKKPIEKLENYYTEIDFSLSSYNAYLGDSIFVCNKVFNFSEMLKPGVFGEKYERHFIEKNDQKIEVFKGGLIIIFESEYINGKFEIQINDRLYKINEFIHDIAKRKEVNKYSVKLKELPSGIYKLKVSVTNLGKKFTILQTQFAVDKNLVVEQVKDTANTYIVSVDSDLMKKTIFDEITIDSFKEDWLNFEWNGIRYVYYIPFDFQLYRINDGRWKAFSEELCIGEISQDSTIDFYGHSYENINLLTSTGQLIEDVPKIKDESVYSRLPAGFLLSYKTNFDYVGIMLLNGGCYSGGVLCYNKCVIDSKNTNVMYSHDDEALVIKPYFYGDGNVRFKIIDDNGWEVFTSSILKKGVIEYVYNLKSFVDYRVIFYEKKKGLSLKKERVLAELPVMFYSREDFVGKSFKIKEVYFDQHVRGEFLRKKHYFNKTYIYFKEMKTVNNFVGEVYARTYNGPFMLDNINPVDIKICSDVIDGIIKLSLTKDGDGLLLDFDHHGIMNSMDDDTAVDIYSYSIDMKGVGKCE